MISDKKWYKQNDNTKIGFGGVSLSVRTLSGCPNNFPPPL